MDDVEAFFDEFAPVFDARYERHVDRVDEDAAFYRGLATSADGPVLEVGVGTGGIYLDILEAGVDIDGIDVSAGMLDRLRERAAERGLEPDVWLADVTNAEFDRTYDLVYVPDRVFNHVVGLDDQRAALEALHDALAPGGRLALNTFVPDFETVVEDYGDPEVDHVTVDGEGYEVRTDARLADGVEQVSTYRVEIRRGDEVVGERETPLALVPKRQFELLFDLAGYSSWEVFGGFDREPLESVDAEQVWIVEK